MADEELDETEQDEDESEGNDESDESEADPGPDTLEPLLDLMEEIESHRTRLNLAAGQRIADPNVPMQEVADTVMSLLQDLATRVYDNLYEIRRYLVAEVEPLVLDGAPAPDSGVTLTDAEAARLVRVLTWIRGSLSQGARPTDETLLRQVESLETDVQVLLGRLEAQAAEQIASASAPS
jgi:hypothetical protein